MTVSFGPCNKRAEYCCTHVFLPCKMLTQLGLQNSSNSTSGLKLGDALLGLILGIPCIPSIACNTRGKPAKANKPTLEWAKKRRRE